MANLGFYVENAPPARLGHVLYGHEASTIEIAGELSVLDECTFGDHLLELILRHKVVMRSVNLSWPR